MHVCRLELFYALTQGGKELELFEEETGMRCIFMDRVVLITVTVARLLATHAATAVAGVGLHVDTLPIFSSLCCYNGTVNPGMCRATEAAELCLFTAV